MRLSVNAGMRRGKAQWDEAGVSTLNTAQCEGTDGEEVEGRR